MTATLILTAKTATTIPSNVRLSAGATNTAREPKTGTSGPFSRKNRYTHSNQVNSTPHEPLYLFLLKNDTGTTECGYYGWVSTVFGFSFGLNNLPTVGI